MKPRSITLFLLAGAFVLMSLVPLSAARAQAGARPAVSPGEYFVGFRGGLSEEGFAAVRGLGATVTGRYPQIRAAAIRVVGNEQAQAATARAIARNPRVSYVEPVPMRYALGLDDEQLVPSRNNGLYGLLATRAIDVHARGVSGAGINVGVADTGLDYYHPDIAPNYRGGIDTIYGDQDPLFESWWDYDWGYLVVETHGTHVAGTVLAANNTAGVLGVAPSANLYHARVLDAYGGTAQTVMDGVRWLVENAQCKVVNLSLGGQEPSITEESFYAEMRSKGALIVCAAGNGGGTSVIYPAGYASNIAVGAVDSDNLHANFSNTGSALDVSAPGVNVISSVPDGSGDAESSVTTTESFFSQGFEFAGITDGITRPMIDCGLGRVGDFPASVAGNIALIRRGELYFEEKVVNATNAGAAAVIMYNNVPGDFLGALPGYPEPWIPVVSVSDTVGAILVSQSGATAMVVNRFSAWATYGGTSMATPHVTGVLALVWSVNPSASNSTVENCLLTTCLDLGAGGYDTTYGFGVVDASAAVARAEGAVPTPPAAPQGLTATAGDERVTLSWSASDSADYYVVKRATSTGGPYQFLRQVSGGTDFTDTGLTNGITYHYVVAAVNAGGASPDSSPASATPFGPTVPAAPTGLSASAQGKRKVMLKWSQSSSAGVAQNRVYRSTTSGGGYFLVATLNATTSFTDAGLASGTTHYYVVTAVGNGGKESAYSNQASVRPR